jgi:hypothetical protein
VAKRHSPFTTLRLTGVEYFLRSAYPALSPLFQLRLPGVEYLDYQWLPSLEKEVCYIATNQLA